jgi:ribose transport system substrate-binding protein
MRKQRFMIWLTLAVVIAAVYSVVYLRMFSGSGSSDKSITVVLKSLNVQSDFWQTVSAGAQAAAKEMGLELDVQGPLQENDVDAQIRVLEEAIVRKPQAIVVAPFADERMANVLQHVREAGIKLVVIDSPLEMSPAPTIVSNDHVEDGRLAGETAANLTNGNPAVVIIGDKQEISINDERMTGLKNSLKEYENGEYGLYYSGGSEIKAYEIALQLIVSHKPFNTFITMNVSATLGVAKALKELNMAGKFKLIGYDSSTEEIQLLEEGVLDATIVQKPFNMGYLGVKTALKLIEGHRIERVTSIESNVITRQNMYMPENQKLLFPFIDDK